MAADTADDRRHRWRDSRFRGGFLSFPISFYSLIEVWRGVTGLLLRCSFKSCTISVFRLGFSTSLNALWVDICLFFNKNTKLIMHTLNLWIYDQNGRLRPITNFEVLPIRKSCCEKMSQRRVKDQKMAVSTTSSLTSESQSSLGVINSPILELSNLIFDVNESF